MSAAAATSSGARLLLLSLRDQGYVRAGAAAPPYRKRPGVDEVVVLDERGGATRMVRSAAAAPVLSPSLQFERRAPCKTPR